MAFSTASQIVLAVLVLFTAAAGITDFRTGHIPNRLTLCGLAAAVATNVVLFLTLLRGPEDSIVTQLLAASCNMGLGLVAAALAPAVLYRVNAIGGGDVKLLAVLGVAAGPSLGLEIELGAFMIAALYAPAKLAYRGELGRLLRNTAALAVSPFLPKEKRRPPPAALMTSIRFAPAVFVSTLLVGSTQWRIL